MLAHFGASSRTLLPCEVAARFSCLVPKRVLWAGNKCLSVVNFATIFGSIANLSMVSVRFEGQGRIGPLVLAALRCLQRCSERWSQEDDTVMISDAGQ